MNRSEKKAKAKAAKKAAKAARYRRCGGTSRYAQKRTWRLARIGGLPIPSIGCATWEEARRLVAAWDAEEAAP